MQMITITMSAKGQFVLPKSVRESLKLRPGCKVQVSIDERGRLILTPALYEPEELFRDRPAAKRVVSLDEMDEAIRRVTRGRS
jgi:AbrB family looped-hinge helix DNA binding protein